MVCCDYGIDFGHARSNGAKQAASLRLTRAFEVKLVVTVGTTPQ